MKLRRIIALFLLLSLTLSLFPVSALALETRTPTLSTDSAFFAKLDLNRSGLSGVKSAVSAGNYTEAKRLLLDYYKNQFVNYNPGYATAAVGSVAVAAIEDTFTFSEPIQSSVKVAYDESSFTEYAFALTKDTSAAYVLSTLDKTTNQVRICSSEHGAESVRPKLLCYDSSKKLIATLSASADGYVDYGKPDTSYGTSTYLYAKDHYTKNSNGTYLPYGTSSRRTYIKFDTAQIPSGTKYTQLVIHARVEGSGTESSIALYQFVSYWKTWTESNLTWNYLVNNDGIGHYSWKGIPGGFDWKEPEGVSNQWYAYNSRFLQMTSLIQQGISGNKTNYITKAKELLLDFIKDVTMTANWEYAGGIQSGNRLMEFPYIYKNLLTYGDLTPDENRQILAWLYDEMVYMDNGGGLFNNSDPSAHGDLVYTNQGFWLLVGFYCGFAYWPEFSSSTQWKNRYVSREDLVLNTLIHKDGSFNEVTFGYPYNVLDWYQHLRSCMVELGDPTKSIDKMDRKFILLCAYLMYCAQSDHSSPNWGQGGAKDITIAVQTLLETIGSAYDSNLLVQNLRYFLDPKTGTAPSTSAQFDGIKVVTDRTGWTAQDSMIFMNAKCAGNHSHRDALALLFYYDGRELLTDTGMTSYSNKHTHYDWQNSISRSHNTIEIDGISQVLYQNLSDVENRGDIRLISNDAAATITAWTTANTNDTHTKSLSMDGVVNNKVYHKTDFTHYRNVSYLKALGDILVVTDKVVPGDSQNHSYTQNWHTEPYSKATVASDSYDTGKTSFSSGANLTIAQVSGNSITPTIRAGYDSTAQSTTTTYFEYKQSASGTVTYQTVLYPTSQGQTVTLKPDKLTMSGTNDSTARAFKATITDSAQSELKTLYYYNSFETTPSTRTFNSYSTNAGTAAVSLNSKNERTFASLSNGSFLRIASSSVPVLQTSHVVTDLGAYMEGTNLYIESSDPQILTAGVCVNLRSTVENVFLNGKAITFTTDSNGTVTLNANALILHFNEVSLLNTEALWAPSRATAKVDTSAGILYGDMTSYDPYIRAESNLSYTLQEGDVLEIRLKVTSTNGADKGTQVFFLTADDGTWNSAKSKLFSNATVNQGYQTLSAAMPSGYVGKTLTALRIDPLNTDKTSTSTGTYEIDYLYIGAPENAPSKQADNLFFDFDSEEKAFFRYQSPIYGGRNYDIGSWSVNEGRNSLPAYDTEVGTVQLWLAPTGTSPYLQTSNRLLDKSAPVLNYVPHKSDIMEVRFKLEDCAVVAGTNPTIRMYYIKNNGTMGNSDHVPVAIPTEALTSGEFVTVRVAMSEAFTSAAVINALRPTFNNICSAEGKTGSLTIDYIYVGAEENAPTKDHLFMGFGNTAADRERYGSYTYGKNNFDDPTNLHWIASGGASLKVDNAAGTIFLTAPKATETMILYTQQDALHYDLSKAEVYQIRFRFENVRVPSGKTPLITMDLYAGSQKVDMEDRFLSATQVTGGNYVTVTVPISKENQAAGIISKLQVYIGQIAADANSKVAIDYIYLGSNADLPTPAYTVTFKDGSGNVLSTQLITKGEEAFYTGSTPTKSYDGTNHYSFKGWDKALTNITANTVITAQFTSTPHSYNSHSYADANTHKATCTCGYIKSENHTVVVDKAVAATCTATGLTEGKHCSVCKAVLVVQEVVPPKDHTVVIDKAVVPTCTATGLTEGKHCDLCNKVLVPQEVIPATGHDPIYTPIDGSFHAVTCKYCTESSEAPHSYTDGICACGEEEIKEPIEDSSLKLNHSLNLASDISVNLLLSKTLLSGFDMSTVYVESTVECYEGNEKTGTYTLKIYPVEKGNYYYFTLDGLTAVHMMDNISSVLYGTKNGQPYYSPVDEYSIATYAYSQLNNAGRPESLKILCADLLRYGTKAQIFKGYRTDALADSAMTNAHKTFLSNMDAVTFGNTNKVLEDLENAPMEWVGKSLNLESKVCLKFIFTLGAYSGKLSDLCLHVSYENANGETQNLTLTNVELYNSTHGYYAFTLDTLLAAELRSVISVQVYHGSTPLSRTLQYSADTYGNNKTGALLDLCKALFAYSDSAKSYFTK